MTKEREKFSDVREEVRQQTSLEGMLGSLAANLSGGVPIPKSSSSAKKSLIGGLPAPEEHHMDISSLANKVPNKVSNKAASQGGHRIGKNAWGQSLLVNRDSSEDSETLERTTSQDEHYGDLGDLTPIIADVMSFQYSENREEEIKQIHAAVRNELSRLCVKRVVANTQKNVKTARNFYMGKSGSIRVEFSILGQKYSMQATGSFRGDEILYPTVEGDSVIGLVMRDSDSGLENATSDFAISINQGWKE